MKHNDEEFGSGIIRPRITASCGKHTSTVEITRPTSWDEVYYKYLHKSPKLNRLQQMHLDPLHDPIFKDDKIKELLKDDSAASAIYISYALLGAEEMKWRLTGALHGSARSVAQVRGRNGRVINVITDVMALKDWLANHNEDILGKGKVVESVTKANLREKLGDFTGICIIETLQSYGYGKNYAMLWDGKKLIDGKGNFGQLFNVYCWKLPSYHIAWKLEYDFDKRTYVYRPCFSKREAYNDDGSLNENFFRQVMVFSGCEVSGKDEITLRNLTLLKKDYVKEMLDMRLTLREELNRQIDIRENAIRFEMNGEKVMELLTTAGTVGNAVTGASLSISSASYVSIGKGLQETVEKILASGCSDDVAKKIATLANKARTMGKSLGTMGHCLTIGVELIELISDSIEGRGHDEILRRAVESSIKVVIVIGAGAITSSSLPFAVLFAIALVVGDKHLDNGIQTFVDGSESILLEIAKLVYSDGRN